MSVYAQVIEGEYDDKLNWPFVGIIKFELLNQLEDRNHYYEALKLTPRHNINVGDDRGYSEYIPHSELSRNCYYCTEYLKDDTLYFRIFAKVPDHKPWLECTV